jgi:(p)ppGpp synthase/HD superfamily hydrolase
MKHIISEAIAFATKMHHGQFDRAGMPYILHVLKVMYLVKSNDEELMAIAVLHDVIEDCFEGRHEEGYQALKDIGMPKRVIDAVRLLTKVPGQTNEEYVERIKTNIDAIRVKLADLRHNMDPRRLKGISEKDRARIDKYVKTFHELTNAKAEEYDRITLHIQNSLHG